VLRFVLLGLLRSEPRYGYELKAVFEQFLGGTWPLNIGQVYTALSRLEKEGLVTCQVVPQELLPDRKVYALTPAGQAELEQWVDEPVDGPVRLRDEFFLKVLVRSLGDPGAAIGFIHRQRHSHIGALSDLTRLQAAPDLHPASALLLEGAVLRMEADLKWLDLCEERMKAEG
jgi:DNA-binding PadR family transcriptional regulator